MRNAPMVMLKIFRMTLPIKVKSMRIATAAMQARRMIEWRSCGE